MALFGLVSCATPVAYVHTDSGFQFPQTVAGFSWESHNIHDRDGQNTSSTYGHESGAWVTVYVYPLRDTWDHQTDPLQAELEASVSDIHATHSELQLETRGAFLRHSATEESSGTAIVMSGWNLAGYTAMRVYTSCYLFRNGPWFIKVRGSYPYEMGLGAQHLIEAFVHALVWPEVDEFVQPTQPVFEAVRPDLGDRRHVRSMRVSSVVHPEI